MTKNPIYAIVVIGTCAALLWWLWDMEPEPNPEFGNVAQPVQPAPSPHLERLPELAVDANDPNLSEKLTQRFLMKGLDAFYSRPIEMYGKVIDQYQQPVVGADVLLKVAQIPTEPGTAFETKSDSAGRFQLSGVRGARISVFVSMDGYHAGSAASGGANPGEVTSDNPAVFVLHKVGEIEQVYYHDHSSPRLRDPRGGTAGFDFKSGSFAKNGAGALQVRITTDIEQPFQSRVNWEYELVIEGGGFAVRNGPLDFIAPEDGYVERISQSFSADDRKGSVTTDYFMKLSDGTFARGKVSVGFAGGTSIVIRDCVYNPSGSRNLELNPKKSNILNKKLGH